MLTNGRKGQFTNNQTTYISSQKSTNSPYKFTGTSERIKTIEQGLQNGLKTEKTNDQAILNELPTNNNKKNYWGSEMTTVNSPSQQLSNSNGYSMVGNNKTALDAPESSSSQPPPLSSSSMNNQASSNIQDNINPSSNMLSGGDKPIRSSSSQYSNVYSSRQDILMQALPSRNASRDINPIMPVAPNGTSEQYGSSQQRSYMSGSNDSQIRGLNRQTNSPFPPNYFPQESHNNQSVSRQDNSQKEERTKHIQWQQALHRFSAPSISSNSSLGRQPPNHSPMQVSQQTL